MRIKRFVESCSLYLLTRRAILAGSFLFLSAFTAIVMPSSALAASQTFAQLSNSIVTIILQAIPVLAGIAFIVFIWGVIKYISSAGSESGLEESKWIIIYGLIGLTAIVCLWGLVNLVTYTFFSQTFQ